MRTSILFLFIVALLGKSPTAQAGDHFRLKNQDKQLHIAAAYGTSLTATLLLEKLSLSRTSSVLWASLFTMALGTAKEFLIDDHYSPGDQTANLIGTAGSAAMVFTFEF